ncbi:hypothetical protein CMV30_03325 [Nibricoccus aquaticus]|uniref:DUF5666 domain-containing protein n=1 Tax=Nibricoccus aquaticus TaxID=2576891 RepID=A0A290QA02_9BACT|nr:hypothetical protein [Nibricoccus aquaticus]ATC63066.1 hypothetical protein CMV30_03325 [Nibricoccus aquaticus]
MRFRAPLSLRSLSLLALALCSGLLPAAPHDQVVIPPAKTSIYIGNVTLTPGILKRENATYTTSYHAKVFPYFFYNEEGQLSIDFSDEQLAQLQRGERVPFTGTAKNKDGEDRRIEGHVTASAPGATEGTIKVRIFVTKKIELIFNSTYQFKP